MDVAADFNARSVILLHERRSNAKWKGAGSKASRVRVSGGVAAA